MGSRCGSLCRDRRGQGHPRRLRRTGAQGGGGEHDLVVVNYANPDMVGHTGSLEAAIVAVETVDAALGKICESVRSRQGSLLV
ncbi:MAG: hypothetical protein I8N66_29985, partial [Ensifer sp. SSB1]|nr:hypothetical protein [Ensifer sp. SSB1]